MNEPLQTPPYRWRSEDGEKAVTDSKAFAQFVADLMSLPTAQSLRHPYIANNLLGLFAGNANIEFGIAKNRFKENIRLAKGSCVTLIDKQFPHFTRLKSPHRFVVQLIEGDDGNVFDFLSKPAPRQYGLVTINGVDYRFNEIYDGGKENTAFLRMHLSRFVSKGGLIIARFDKGEQLLDDRQVWKLIYEKPMMGGAFIRQ
ncbi:MAG: hypothetical protein Q7R95_07390 [bacterium]|nr:hypothetical protein [bacterium]